MLKIAKLFYFCHLKKLVRPETVGPYYVSTIRSLNSTPRCFDQQVIIFRDTVLQFNDFHYQDMILYNALLEYYNTCAVQII